MITARLLAIAAIAPLLVGATARAGVVRYELPDLLGEHRFDANDDFRLIPSAHVDTPFGFYGVSTARLVVEGTVTAGRAHGDGVLREAVTFDLVPSVFAHPSFSRVINVPSGLENGPFRIDETYNNPFEPEITPLPNPDGYPPVSFDVSFSVGPSFDTQYPARLTPPPGSIFLPWYDGIIGDVPIVANVTAAYIVLEGPAVPEPAAWAIAAAAVVMAGLVQLCRRRRSC